MENQIFNIAEDGINGAEGYAQATIDGVIHRLFDAKKIEAKFDKQKSELRVMGSRAIQNRAKGWKGTGSMTLYYATSVFREAAIKYIETGKDLFFDLLVVNEDPQTTLGKQTMLFTGCNIDSTVLAKLDIDADAMDEEVSFTFTGVKMLDKFSRPTYIQ